MVKKKNLPCNPALETLILERFPLPGTKRILMLLIAKYQAGGIAFPSIKTLGRLSAVSERNVQVGMSYLISDGWIKVVGNYYGGKRGQTRHYKINQEMLLTGDGIDTLLTEVDTGDENVTLMCTQHVKAKSKATPKAPCQARECGGLYLVRVA